MATNLPVPQNIHDSLQGGIKQYQPAATKVLADAHVCDIFAFPSQGIMTIIISFPVTVINITSSFINLLVYLYE
jgi:hypothetical protein